MKKLLLAIITSFLLVSCIKEIDIDLNSSNAQIVIEGLITNQTGVQTVKISRSVNFSDPSNYPVVQGALVMIQDNLGNSEILKETQNGIYKTQNFAGVSGRTYTLSVTTDGKTFTAQSTMPEKVPFEGINLKKNSAGFPPSSDGNYMIYPDFKDPIGQNYYRFVLLVNGTESNEILVQNDNNVDGLPNNRPIFSRNTTFKQADTLTVQLHCLEKEPYEYLYSLSGGSGGSPNSSATPANPISNIKGGALGYFSAHTIEQKTIIVP